MRLEVWAPHATRMDYLAGAARTALHPEGEARNWMDVILKRIKAVALHPEGVDRYLITY